MIFGIRLDRRDRRHPLPHLTRILGALGQSGAHENVGNVLDVAGSSVHALALLVGDDGHVHVLDHIREWSV